MEFAGATFGAEWRLIRRPIHEEIVLNGIDCSHAAMYVLGDSIRPPMEE